jgi:putative FmdB family regulatory protein
VAIGGAVASEYSRGIEELLLLPRGFCFRIGSSLTSADAVSLAPGRQSNTASWCLRDSGGCAAVVVIFSFIGHSWREIAVPLYEYKCGKCGHKTEKIESYDAPETKKCPKCGAKAERVISSSAIQFKGSGWYVTDYGGKNAAGKSGDGESKPAAAKDDTAAAKKTDSSKESKSKESSTKESSSKESGSKEKSKKS